MTQLHPTLSGFAATAVAALATTATAVVVGFEVGGEAELKATLIAGLGDSDGDGISDTAEAVAFTNPTDADTDGDGYSDIEELARGTDPLELDFSPPLVDRSIGIKATGDGSIVRADVALYLATPDFTDLDVDVGVFLKDGNGIPARFPLPPSLTYANGSFDFTQGGEPGSLVFHFNVDIPQALYESFGWVGIYAAAGPLGAPTAADAQTIVYEGGVLMSLEPQPMAASFASAMGSQQVGGITVTPIEPEQQLPTSMTPDQLCFQAVSAAGSTGGLIQLQVDSADCVEADFFYCSPSCDAAVGGTRSLVDPLALIGG